MKKILNFAYLFCLFFLFGCQNKSPITEESQTPPESSVATDTEILTSTKTVLPEESSGSNLTISTEKIKSSKKAGVPIIVPRYIPIGFKLVKFESSFIDNSDPN